MSETIVRVGTATVQAQVVTAVVASLRVSGGVPGPPGSAPLAMSIRGILAVGVGVIPLPMPVTRRIVNVRAAVGTAPTGSSIIFDVKANGISIFTGQPLAIAAGQTLSPVIVPTDDTILAGDVLTVDVVQIGSAFAGANATIVLDVV